jgi:hypothetical protein
MRKKLIASAGNDSYIGIVNVLYLPIHVYLKFLKVADHKVNALRKMASQENRAQRRET